MPVIETGSSEWHSDARPSSYIRKMVGNRGIEPRTHIGAGFTDPLSHQTCRCPLVAGPGVAPGSSRLMRPHGFLTDQPAIKVPGFSPGRAGVHPAWREMAERRGLDLHAPRYTIGVRSRAGDPFGLPLLDIGSRRPSHRPPATQAKKLMQLCLVSFVWHHFFPRTGDRFSEMMPCHCSSSESQ